MNSNDRRKDKKKTEGNSVSGDVSLLVIEDNPADFALVKGMLSECVNPSFEIQGAGLLEDGLSLLDGGAFDAVLLDMGLPDSRGLEGLERIGAAHPGVPVVILTGGGDEKIGIQAIQHRAADYLNKSTIDTNLLVRSIRYAMERSRAERELRESEERFRNLVSAMTEGVVLLETVCDEKGEIADFRVVSANRALESQVGIGPGEALGRCLGDLGGVYEVKYSEVLKSVAEGGAPAGFETYVPQLERHYRIYAFSPWPGQIAVVFDDITGRRMAEEEMRLTLEATTDGIWKRSYVTGNVYFSPRYYTMLGYEPGDFSPNLESWKSLIHPDDYERAMKVHEEFENGNGDIYINEFRMRTKTGGYRLIHSRGRVVKRDERGGRVRIIGNHDDVTDERAAELKLEETTRLLETIIDNTDILVAYLDPRFNYIRVNRAFADAEGRDISFYEGKNRFDLCPMDESYDVFRSVAVTGRPHTEKAGAFAVKDGGDRGVAFWDWSLIPIKNNDGSVRGLVFTLMDVTLHRNVEASLKRFNERLEEVVARRTEELTQANRSLRNEIERRSLLELETEKAYAELDMIFNSTAVGMVVVDQDCNLMRVNRRFADMLGADPEALFGATCRDIFRAERCASEYCPIQKILEGEERDEYELVYAAPSGNELVFQVSATPYYSAARGSVSGMILNFVDITEKRDIQRKLISIIDEERQKISHDLHDGLGQHLTAAGFVLESVRQKIGARKDLSERLDRIARIIQESQNQTRALSRLLSPVEMEKSGFESSLATLAWNVEQIFGLKCTVRFEGETVIEDNAVATNLYYIVREAVNNAVKHGGTKSIAIEVDSGAAQTSISVKDDGRGASAMTAGEGMGLKIMRHRAEIAGASFKAGNRRGGGFAVTVTLPKR